MDTLDKIYNELSAIDTAEQNARQLLSELKKEYGLGELYQVVNYDLKKTELDKTYPGGSSKAYKELANFLEKYGFERIQLSSWISKEPVSNLRLTFLMYRMVEELPWITEYAHAVDSFMASKKLSLIDIMGADTKESYSNMYNKPIQLEAQSIDEIIDRIFNNEDGLNEATQEDIEAFVDYLDKDDDYWEEDHYSFWINDVEYEIYPIYDDYGDFESWSLDEAPEIEIDDDLEL